MGDSNRAWGKGKEKEGDEVGVERVGMVFLFGVGSSIQDFSSLVFLFWTSVIRFVVV